MTIPCLIEIQTDAEGLEAFHAFTDSSTREAEHQTVKLLDRLARFVDIDEMIAPVPMFEKVDEPISDFTEFATSTNESTGASDRPSVSKVISARLNTGQLTDLSQQDGVTVWPDSELTLFERADAEPMTTAMSGGGTDCRPFRPAVSMDTIRRLLGVEHVWSSGYRGQNVVVGIIDDGVNGDAYPVIGGGFIATVGPTAWCRAHIKPWVNVCRRCLVVRPTRAFI